MTILLLPVRLLFLAAAAPLLAVLPWLARVLFGLKPVPPGVPPAPPPPGGKPRELSVVIVSFDGRALLERSLPPLKRELAKLPGEHQIIVVDNGSRDGTRDWLARAHPDVEVVALERNVGFGPANNEGLARVRHPHVLLLNNDMIVQEGFFEPLVAGFTDRGVFAVSARIELPGGRRQEESGRTRIALRYGRFEYTHDPVEPRDGLVPVAWAGGGASLFDVEKLRHLAGFEPAFAPAYVEDTDLAWRAWKHGWRSLLAPGAVALHEHRATSRRVFSKRRLAALVAANQWIFQLRSLTSPRALAATRRWLPLWIAYGVLCEGLWPTLRVWARVLAALPRIRAGRRALAGANRIPDEGILSLDRRYTRPGERNEPPRVLVVAAYAPRPGVHAGGQRIHQLVRRLAPRFRITVLAYAESPEEEEAARSLAPFCEEVRTVIRGQTPDEPNPFFAAPPGIPTEFGNPRMRRELELLLASGRFDLVQFEYLQTAYLLPPFCSLPKTLVHHEVQHFAFRRRLRTAAWYRKPREALLWLMYLLYERRVCRDFDLIVTMTDEDAAELLALDPELPVRVNNTGVDTQALRPAPEPQEPVLCYVGYYRHAPNVRAVLRLARRILPLVRREIPAASLRIIGAEPPPEVTSLAAEPGIEVTGRVPSIAPEVHRAKVFVVPLDEGVGIRGKILEAWALGRAVVTTPLGAAGLRLVSGEHALVAESDEEIAAAVVRLLGDDDLRGRIVANALRRARTEYSWDVKAEEHARLWHEALELCGACRRSPWRRIPAHGAVA